MDATTMRMLVDYNFRAHRAVWECADELTEEQYFHDFGYSFDTLHGQFAHALAAESVWLSRIKDGVSPERLSNATDFASRGQLRARWDEIETEFREYVWGLSDEDFDKDFSYTNTRGIQYSNNVGHILLHVINHGTDFRAQILYMIHQLGGRTLEQDLLHYLR